MVFILIVLNIFPIFFAYRSTRCSNEQRDILQSISEGRHADRKNIQPVKHVLPKRACRHSSPEVAIGRGDDANSTEIGWLLPTRSNSRSWITRSSVILVPIGSSPISSRKIVLPWADSKRPRRRCNAPVKAPLSWPNNSEAISEGGMAAQFTRIKGRVARFDCS
jgi:hypothetical protein